MSLILTADANPGSATWVETTLGASSPGRVYWVDGSLSLTNPNGSATAPFSTIQAALEAIGAPAAGDSLDALAVYTIFVAAGIYDEAIAIPNYRSVNIIGLGLVYIGSPLTTLKTITVQQGTPATNPGVKQRVSIHSADAPDGAFSADRIIVSSLAAESLTLTLAGVSLSGTTGAGIDASGFTGGGSCSLFLKDSFVFTDDPLNVGTACVEGPALSPNGNELLLNDIRNCRLTSSSLFATRSINASSYAHIQNCHIDHGIVFNGNPSGTGAISFNGTRPAGFFDCSFGLGVNFSGTAAGDLHVDATTNYSFKASPGTLTAPSTKTVISDTLP